VRRDGRRVVGADRPHKYWNDLKTKLLQESDEQLSEKIVRLKMTVADGMQHLAGSNNTDRRHQA